VKYYKFRNPIVQSNILRLLLSFEYLPFDRILTDHWFPSFIDKSFVANCAYKASSENILYAHRFNASSSLSLILLSIALIDLAKHWGLISLAISSKRTMPFILES